MDRASFSSSGTHIAFIRGHALLSSSGSLSLELELYDDHRKGRLCLIMSSHHAGPGGVFEKQFRPVNNGVARGQDLAESVSV